MLAKMGRVGWIGCLLFSGAVFAWDYADVQVLFTDINMEIANLRYDKVATQNGGKHIVRSMAVVFAKHPAFIKFAERVAEHARNNVADPAALIKAWHRLANYALWGACHYGQELPLIFARAVDDYRQIFARQDGFASLVRDLQFKNLQEEDLLAQQDLAAFNQTALQIMQDYLYQEGVLVFEYLPSALPANHPGSRYGNMRALKEAVAGSGEYRLNLFLSSTRKALSFAKLTDPSLKEWLEFINDALEALGKIKFFNGKSLGQEFTYINFALNFDFDFLPDGQTKPIPLTQALDDLVQTHLYAIHHQTPPGPQGTQIIAVQLNLLPGVLAVGQKTLLKKKQQLKNELVSPLGLTWDGKTPLPLVERVTQYALDHRLKVDKVVNLINPKSSSAPCPQNLRP